MQRGQSPANRLLVAVWLMALAAAACGPGADQNLLSDPREIVGRTIQVSAELKTVRARFDVQQHREPTGLDAPRQARDETAWLEISADFGALAVAARGAGNDGQAIDFVLVGGAFFTKVPATGRWSKTTLPVGVGLNPAAIFGGAVPGAAPDIGGALLAALADPTVQMQLRGVEDCRSGRCYRTTIAIPPAVVWNIVKKISGIDRMDPSAAEQPQTGVPEIDLELLIDTKTNRLMEAWLSGTAGGTTVRLRGQFANHDEQIAIGAPNPALVDDQGNFGFGGGGGGGVVGPAPSGCVTTGNTTTCTIINQVGSELSPEPSE
jgi:hypothetical protein